MVALFTARGFFLAILAASFLPMSIKAALHLDGSRDAHTSTHLIVFSVLAGIVRFAFRHLHALEAALLTIAGGALVEVLEAVTFHNALEWRDIGLDGAAACAGALVSDWLLCRFCLRESRAESGGAS